jgi:hypothetical protein
MKARFATGILTAALITAILSACSGAHREELSPADSTGQEINLPVAQENSFAFSADSLPEVSLEAFEVRGRQKLQDMADYISILSDTGTEPAFREQARQMLLENFTNPSAAFCLSSVPWIKSKHFSIEQFADSLFAGRFPKLLPVIENIRLQQPLQPVNSSEYKGSLDFSLKWVQEKPTIPTQEMEVIIVLRKNHKKFGEEEKEVWEVLLGEMNEKSSR